MLLYCSIITVHSSQAHAQMKLSTLVDDKSWAELNALTVTEGSSFVHFKVFAVARYQGTSFVYQRTLLIDADVCS
jgi:hypothetical protein